MSSMRIIALLIITCSAYIGYYSFAQLPISENDTDNTSFKMSLGVKVPKVCRNSPCVHVNKNGNTDYNNYIFNNIMEPNENSNPEANTNPLDVDNWGAFINRLKDNEVPPGYNLYQFFFIDDVYGYANCLLFSARRWSRRKHDEHPDYFRTEPVASLPYTGSTIVMEKSFGWYWTRNLPDIEIPEGEYLCEVELIIHYSKPFEIIYTSQSRDGTYTTVKLENIPPIRVTAYEEISISRSRAINRAEAAALIILGCCSVQSSETQGESETSGDNRISIDIASAPDIDIIEQEIEPFSSRKVNKCTSNPMIITSVYQTNCWCWVVDRNYFEDCVIKHQYYSNKKSPTEDDLMQWNYYNELILQMESIVVNENDSWFSNICFFEDDETGLKESKPFTCYTETEWDCVKTNCPVPCQPCCKRVRRSYSNDWDCLDGKSNTRATNRPVCGPGVLDWKGEKENLCSGGCFITPQIDACEEYWGD